MTGRVCPVHAEYSASGVCRWCDPAEEIVAVADKVSTECIGPLSRYWPVKSVTRDELVEMFGEPGELRIEESESGGYDWTLGIEVDSPEELARINADVVGESPGASALRDVNDLIGMEAMQEWERILGPPPKPLPESYALRAIQLSETRIKDARFREDVRLLKDWLPELAIVEEAGLLADHAALRWERVARKWNYKHRGSELSERDRDRVWMHWLQQMDRRFPRP